MPKYQIEVKVWSAVKRDYSWEKLSPTNGAPYVFGSRAEAANMARMCYPEHQEYVRIVEAL